MAQSCTPQKDKRKGAADRNLTTAGAIGCERGREGGPVGRTDEGAQFRLVESVSLLSRGQSFWSQGVVCNCLARMAGPEAQIDTDDQSRLNRMTVSTPNCVKPIGVDTGFSV